MRLRTLMGLMLALVMLLTLPTFAQTVKQPRVGIEPLDNYTAVLASSSNGSRLIYGLTYEDITLSTSGTTTDSTKNLLPANAIILGVTGTVLTDITTGCTGWQLGDPTTAGRFTASNTTLTAGTSDYGKVMLTTGIASATTGAYQAAAAKVRITCATAAPGAGKVRVSVAYLLLTPPTL